MRSIDTLKKGIISFGRTSTPQATRFGEEKEPSQRSVFQITAKRLSLENATLPSLLM